MEVENSYGIIHFDFSSFHRVRLDDIPKSGAMQCGQCGFNNPDEFTPICRAFWWSECCALRALVNPMAFLSKVLCSLPTSAASRPCPIWR